MADAAAPTSPKKDDTPAAAAKGEPETKAGGEGDTDVPFRVPPAVVPRRELGEKATFGKVVLQEYSGIDVDGAVIIDGFPAGTVTATIAAGCVRWLLCVAAVVRVVMWTLVCVCAAILRIS